MNGNGLVGLDSGNGIPSAAGPNDLDTHGLVSIWFAQSESQWQFALRQIARSGLDHPKKALTLICFEGDLGADAVPVRPCAHSPHAQHVILIRIVIAQQTGRPMVVHDQQVEIAIVVEVG